MVTPDQTKAARKLLGWSISKLAIRARMSSNTVSAIERSTGDGLSNNRAEAVLKLLGVLEAAGVEFIPENGGGGRPAQEKGKMNMPTKTAAKTTTAEAPAAKKPSGALAKPVQPSKELGAIVGHHAIPRTEVDPEALGLHQEAQPAEPGEQARDHRRREAQGRVRAGQGDDVRDEQADLAAFEMTGLRGPKHRDEPGSPLSA